MIDRGRVLEAQLVERYVAGQLTLEEIREFEEAMLEHPEVLEQVEHARTLKLGLKTLRDRGELDTLVRAGSGTRQWWLAAAAAAVICAVGLVWFKARSETPTILATSLDRLTTWQQHTSAGNDFLIATTRGAGSISIEATAADPVIVLRVLIPASRVGKAHHAELFHGNNRIAKVDGVAGGDYLPLYLDTARLETGDYQLRLTTTDEPAPTTTYPLHLTRK